MAGCATLSAQVYEDCGAPAQGLAKYNALDPNSAAIKAAVASSKPPKAPNSYLNVCEAMLRSGGMIYYKNSPGDCGAPGKVPGFGSGQIAGLSGQAASGVVGGLGVAGIIGGAATLGISAAVAVSVGAIEQIISHHAAAVADEQGTLCSVVAYFNQAKFAIDGAVRAGQISPDQAVSYLTQVANQVQSGLASIEQTCNAACVYGGVAQAFMNFSRTWYDSISPNTGIFPQAPGGPPTYYGTPPGGVTSAPGSLPPAPPIRALLGNEYAPAGPQPGIGLAPPLNLNAALPGNTKAPDYLNQGYNQQTGQSGQAADVPPSTINWTMIGAIVGIIALLFALKVL
jgi:hypothetical protein